MHHHGLTPNPTAFSCPPGCPALGRACSEFWGWVVSLTDGQWVQTLLKGRLAMPRGWCCPSVPASTSSRLCPAASAGPGVGGDTSWSCCLWREKEAIGKRFVICTFPGSEAGWVHAGWEKEEMWGVAVKSCLVFPLCHAQVLHHVPLAASTRLCQPSHQESSQHLNSHRYTFIPCQAAWFRLWYGGITHLELILMLVVDLRAGNSTWLSSASTDWRRLSFTTYWLLLVGCHSTPKILKKEKQGEKTQPFLFFLLLRRFFSPLLAAKELSSPQNPLLALQNVRKENPDEPSLFADVGAGSTR